MMESLELTRQLARKMDPGLERYIVHDFKSTLPDTPVLDERYTSIDLLTKISITHLEYLFEGYPKKDILFIQNHLKKELPFYPFLKQEVLKRLFTRYPVLPYAYLPSFPNATLLFCDSALMQEVCALLGLYDLKALLKTLIDQKMIKLIEHALSTTQKKFLKIIQKEADKIAFKPIPLERWDQTAENLQALLMMRGLNRLAKAFANSSPYIQNEFIIRLPFKDKMAYLSLSTPVIPQRVEALQKQIETTQHFLKL